MITSLAWLYFSLLRRTQRLNFYPQWRLGSGEPRPDQGFNLRSWLWVRLESPAVIRWVQGLKVTVYPRNEISRSVFLTGAYEPNEMTWLSRYLKPGMVFIDLGANMGLYSLIAARAVGRSGRVIALDPSPREFERLSRNLTLNGLANVLPLKIAVSDFSGDGELLVAADEKSGHNTLGTFGYDSVIPTGKVQVEVDTLDALVARLDLHRVDAIKLDVEGAEYRALQGAARVLDVYRPALIVEMSERTLSKQSSSVGMVWDLLASAGYRVFSIEAGGEPLPVGLEEAEASGNCLALHRDRIPG